MKNSLSDKWLSARVGRILLLLTVLLLPALRAAAQTASDSPEMADALRGSGKIYVVVTDSIQL